VNAVRFLRRAAKNDIFSHASLYHRAFDQWFLSLRGATGVNVRDLEHFLEACRKRNIRNTMMSEFQQNMILEAWLGQDGGGELVVRKNEHGVTVYWDHDDDDDIVDVSGRAVPRVPED
jgi:hypothetical protein